MDNSVPQKQCAGPCQRILPATNEFFHVHKLGKYGLARLCKECACVAHKEYRETHKEELRVKKREYQQAHKKEISEKNKAYRETHKEELRAYQQVYRQAHHEKHITYTREYWRTHTEERRAYYELHREEFKTRREEMRAHYQALAHAYYQAHIEEVRSQHKLYYQTHKEERREHYQTYRQTHRAEILARKHKRRALQRGNGGIHTNADIQHQYKGQKGKCYYCHKKLGKTYHRDHIVPLARGGSNNPDNIVLTCPTCNLRKGAKLPHEWSEGGRLL